MADLELSYSATSSALSRPLLDGAVKIEGVKFKAEEAHGMDKLSRRMLSLEFDVAEMSIATFVKGKEGGLPLVALPVFTSGRRFLQKGFLVARKAGIHDLSELKGKRMGVSQYWMSSSVWQRLVLRQMHGVMPEDVTWVTTRGERMEGLRFPLTVKIIQDKSNRTPLDLMRDGQIDACMSPGTPQPGTQADQLSDVAMPAYADGLAAQKEYFVKTGIFPIMHVTVMKEKLVADYPWLPARICDAYREAKKQAEVPSPAAGSHGSDDDVEEMRAIMGDDPWPYGIRSNRRPLEAFVEAAYNQGLIGRPMKLEDLFTGALPEIYQ
ncbi:MAG TPA: hypothetical protein VGB25_01590 [Candidatus Binatia bacterium]